MSESEETKIPNSFKKKVSDWINIDDKIRNVIKEAKELKEEKKKLENDILENMDNLNLLILDVGNGKIRKNISKTKGALKEEIIKDSLFQIFKDDNQASQTTQFILDSRPIVESTRLKRTFKRNI
jgi:seryl-tRNA synthetase